MLFDETILTAIHQGSGGIYLKAKRIARDALIAAAMRQQKTVNAEHFRLTAIVIFNKETAMGQQPIKQDVSKHFN